MSADSRPSPPGVAQVCSAVGVVICKRYPLVTVTRQGYHLPLKNLFTQKKPPKRKSAFPHDGEQKPRRVTPLSYRDGRRNGVRFRPREPIHGHATRQDEWLASRAKT